MTDFSDNENSLGSSPNSVPENQTNKADDGKKEADKPIRPNPDVEGGNGPVTT